MKVLFVAPSAYPLGGVAEWLEYLMHGLERRGWHCSLGLVEGPHNRVEPYLARHPWHDVRRIANTTGSREGRVEALAHAIREQQPDIVAVANIVDAYAAVRRLRRHGKTTARVVMTLHGLQGDLLADVHGERDVLDAVVATNKLAVGLAAASLGNAERGFYAAYGVSIAEEFIATARGRDAPLRLIHCGRLDQQQKRILDLPDLLLRLRDRGIGAGMSIAGGGPDEVRLRDKVAALGLQDDVHFLGVLDAQELASEYHRHDALVITSSWETGPMVALEAMSHGLPVLTSRYLGSGREGALIDGRNCLLFPVGDMQAAAMGAERLAAPEVRARIAQGGFELVRTRYSRDASVAQWESAFAQIMELPQLPSLGPPPAVPSHGRLDRLFGARLGERVRRVLGIAFAHGDAGSEWPHTANAHVHQAAWLASVSDQDIVR